MKILVTGFDPFGGESLNPAFEAVKLLPDNIAGAEIIKLEIPTVFGKGAMAVEKAIEEHKPNCVVCVGQAGGRSCISIEKVGINYIDARIPDNDGNQPFDVKIKEDGENAYFATLPIKAMVENVKKHGLQSHLSFTAGTYVCNDVMYSLLYYINKNNLDIKGGFIHVPYTISQTVDKANGTPGWSEDCIAKGLEYAIEAIALNEEDKSIALGTTH